MDADLVVAPVQKTKHPKQLYSLSLVTGWTMFAYYGTTALLIAYIVTQMHFTDTQGYAIFGTFSALAFGLPLFCGAIADKILGKRKSMLWGTLLHFIGLTLLVFPYRLTFFTGLAIFVAGSGFFNGMFKAFLGDFYDADDAKGKDDGYTILYGLFNVGVALGAIVCGYIGQEISWKMGFGVAAIGGLLSFLCMIFGISKEYGQPVDMAKTKQKIIPGITMEMLVYILTIPAIGLITWVFLHPGIMDVVLFPLAIVAFLYIIYRSFSYTKAERFKIFASLISFLVYVFFLALYEQSGGSFNLFVLRNMDMHVGSVLLPGLAINNFLTGFLPSIMMPLMIYIWSQLNKIGREPGTIMKFIIGFLFMAGFFGLFWWGCRLYSSTGMVPVYFLFGGYILMEFSELSIGPIMYSLTYKLSPNPIAGTMMGVLGIAAALGEYMASKIGNLTTVPPNITDPVKTLPYYTTIYGELALVSVGVALLFTLLLPVFKKLMQDVT
jgi:POT family proton-dependent oligopeptide transporter